MSSRACTPCTDRRSPRSGRLGSDRSALQNSHTERMDQQQKQYVEAIHAPSSP